MLSCYNWLPSPPVFKNTTDVYCLFLGSVWILTVKYICLDNNSQRVAGRKTAQEIKCPVVLERQQSWIHFNYRCRDLVNFCEGAIHEILRGLVTWCNYFQCIQPCDAEVMLKLCWSFWWQNVLQAKKVCFRRKGEALAEIVFVMVLFCWMYLVRTASSSGAHAWDTGHHGSSLGPCCSRVCHSSQSCPQDSPGTLPCNTQAGHSRRLTACTHFPPVSTVGWRKKQVVLQEYVIQ